MTEKQFEEFLRDAVSDYNTPGDTPREEIWARVAEAREKGQEGQEGQEGQRGRWWLVAPVLRWGVAAAAILVLGIGIGMNLDSMRDSLGGASVVADAESATADTEALAYRLAALEHFVRAEVFLTMFRSDVRAGRTDYQVSNPARDLLTTTRLLRGSPAASDQRMSELLNDLELVLVQIAQLRAELNGDELGLVAQGMDETAVLLKLRAAVPADPVLRGIQGVL